MHSIEVNRVSKSYRQQAFTLAGSIRNFARPVYKTVLKGVSFRVNEGELFGLLGPNGAGKTTLIKIMLGLVEADSGSVKVLGYRIPGERKKIINRVNVVFSRGGCYWNLSGMDHLKFYGRLYRTKDLDRKIKEVLDIFELHDVIDMTTDKYSTGEVMRLHLARALLNDPEMLILDEPTVGLDPYMALKVRDLFRRLNKEKGMTMVLTTHYMEEADRLCDRVAIIDNGRIAKVDTPEGLKKNLHKSNVVEIRGRGIDTEVIDDLKTMNFVNGVYYVSEENRVRIIMRGKSHLNDVMDFLKHTSVRITEINTDRPTLEDVFLDITGRRLRGEE